VFLEAVVARERNRKREEGQHKEKEAKRGVKQNLRELPTAYCGNKDNRKERNNNNNNNNNNQCHKPVDIRKLHDSTSSVACTYSRSQDDGARMLCVPVASTSPAVKTCKLQEALYRGQGGQQMAN
jgi:hypothetical protein